MTGKVTILLTGATGTIGKVLTKHLIALGYNIIIIVRNLQKSHELFGDSVNHIVFNGENFHPSLNSLHTDIVIHLASYSTSNDDTKNIINLIDSNILFVSLLLKGLENSSLKLFINTGSFSEFHHNDGIIEPTYFYSATKTSSRYIIDYFSKLNGFIFVNAVLYSVYGQKGEQKKIIDYMIEATQSNLPIPMSEGYQIMDFIHIDDVIRFYLLLIQNYDLLSVAYHEYHIGTGTGVSIRELADTLYEVSGIHPNVIWNANQARKRDTIKAIANTNNVINELGWKASIPLSLGLRKYLNYYGNEDAKSV